MTRTEQQHSGPPGPTLTQNIFYGIGHFGLNNVGLVMATWYARRYCPPEGAPLVSIGALTTAFALAKILDGFLGPAVGYWSDRTRTRLGRRIPFVLFGALPMCVLFFLVWTPPVNLIRPQSNAMLAYFIFSVVAFWIVYTITFTPYTSLLPEIAVTGRDRINMATFQTAGILLSSFVVFGAAPVMVQKLGFLFMGAFFTVISLIAVYLPLLSLREKYRASETSEPRSYTLVQALSAAGRNRPFLIFLGATFFNWAGLQIAILTVGFIVPVIFRKPDTFISVILIGANIFTVISFFIIQKLTRLYDKRTITLWGMALYALMIPGLWFMGRYELGFHIGSFAVTEAVIAFALFTLLGFPIAVQLVLQAPLVADCIDYDELLTGKRQEAIYFGLLAAVLKIALAACSGIFGFLFRQFGYTVNRHIGVDLIGLAGAGLTLIAFLIFLFYPINGAMERDIRHRLDKRGSAANCQ